MRVVKKERCVLAELFIHSLLKLLRPLFRYSRSREALRGAVRLGTPRAGPVPKAAEGRHRRA